MADSILTLETERLTLRIIDPSEASSVVAYLLKNNEHLANAGPAYFPDYFTEQYWKRQLATNVEEFRNDKSARMFIYYKGDLTRIIGSVNLSEFVRRAAQFCYLGYGIDHKEEGKGLMFEAAQHAVEYGFSDLNLHRIMANYIPQNIRSGNLLKRLGFNVDGYARDYLFINGVWQDHVMTSLTNPNWKDPA